MGEVGETQSHRMGDPETMADTRIITQRALLTLLQAQGYRCALTGRPLDADSATLDHRVPIARGGEHAVENVWIVHSDANRAKGTLTAEEFIRLCSDVINYQAHATRTKPVAPLPPGVPEAVEEPAKLPLFEDNTHDQD